MQRYPYLGICKQSDLRNNGGDSQQWISLFPYLEDAGSGVLDLKAIIPAAQKSGVEHFFIERDLAPEPEVNLRKSFEFLSALK